MPRKSVASGQYLDDKPRTRSSTSRSPSRSPVQAPPSDLRNAVKEIKAKAVDYTSDGVKDYDIFGLPNSDFSILGFLILLATIVRLYRLYQPDSVVFDEVQ